MNTLQTPTEAQLTADVQAGHPGAKRYITALDGLRAFAVLAVILYHLGAPFAQGGLLGVTVFFVISGYLITGLLTAEWETTNTIRLGRFWLRRVRRLFPAIVTVIVVMAALFTLFSHELLTKMRPDIVPGLFWFTNWWYILRDISYFDALGSPSPLTHFWSLAIEEQFYLIWPLILLGVFKGGVDKTAIRRGCLVLAGISALAMALIYDPSGDPTRVYYGTDTRAFSLLIGAWLSFVWPGTQLTAQSTQRVARNDMFILDAVGIAAFLGIVVLCVAVNGFAPFMYYGGILLASILSAVVIAVLVHPRSMFAHVAEHPILVWIGQRSYGMYLWHYPFILLLAQVLRVPGGTYPWWFDILVIALVFAAAHLSYTFIENPIRHGALGRWFAGVRDRMISPIAFFREHLPQTAAVALTFALALGGIALVPDTSLVPEEAIQSTGVAADQAIQVEKEEVAKINGYRPLLIGDSVPGDAEAEFYSIFPDGLTDCYIGRQPSQAVEVLQDYMNQNAVGNVVVAATFNNGYVTTEDLENMLGILGSERTLFLVNVVALVGDDAAVMAPNNEILQSFAESHSNVTLIDWASYCSGHESEWLYDDGEHLRPEAYQIYMDFLNDHIKDALPKDTTTSEQSTATSQQLDASSSAAQSSSSSEPQADIADLFDSLTSEES